MSIESDYVVGCARPEAQQNLIVVSGCSSGGKSSLLNELAQRGFSVVPEPGRQVVREHLQIGGDALPWHDARKFVELCVSRGMHHYNTRRDAQRPVFFDRSMLDNIRGMQGLGGIPEYMSAAVRQYRYAQQVFFAPPWEAIYENDAERRHSFAQAVAEYEVLRVFYADAGYSVVELPRASIAARAEFVVARLNAT